MRRFSRRRRGGSSGDGRAAPIDAARWLQRIQEEGGLGGITLEALSHDDVPDHYAAVGRGTREDGTAVVVTFAPRHAGDAMLAALATGVRLAEEESFAGELIAVAPQWTIASRRRLGLMKAELPYRFRAIAASSLSDGNGSVESEAALEPTILSVSQVCAHLREPVDRELFARAAAALEGLASKHGGSIRAVGRSVELVLMARRVAELRVDDDAIELITLLPQRSSVRLSAGELAAALDGLEGQLRRRLNDRRLRDGEEGMRARVTPLIATACSLRASVPWPLGGSDSDEIDLVGVDPEGRPVVAAARVSLGLPALGAIFDAAQSLRLALPTLLADAPPPVRIEAPRLVLAAQEFSSGALRALKGISLAHELLEIRASRDSGFEIASVGSEEAARSVRERSTRGRSRGGRRRGGRPEPRSDDEPQAGAEEAEKSDAQAGDARADTSAVEDGGGSRPRRRGRRRGRGRAEGDDSESTDSAESEGAAATPRFEEVSVFDLEEGGSGARSAGGSDEGGSRRRRGRSRRRGRRGSNGDETSEDGGDGSSEPLEGTRAPRARADRSTGDAKAGGGDGRSRKQRSRGKGGEASDEDEGEDAGEQEPAEDLTEILAELPDDLPGIGAVTPVGYAEDDDGAADGAADESASPEGNRTLERENRRLARKAKKEEIDEAPRQPRRRALIVSQADRDSLIAAILLARDVRLVEGLWVYTQADLMNFFREAAADIREDVPIYLVGFVPSPARDVIQAASLYKGRLIWFDHHEWPPEDIAALHAALGEDAVHHTAHAGSSLPGLLETCTRRSRFSDKLVDLATGRFTEHDYERWGRVWWSRLGEVASKSGDVRSEINPLLTGRPSDLAKEAARADTPPIPVEVDYISRRDFRLVHFAGYAMALVDVEGDHDLHLAGRIARERFSCPLSLAYRQGSNLFLFGGEELSGRRTLDFGALSEHLADKLEWVESLSDNDHVARFRIEGLDRHPERLEEVIGEIAMGRSILER
jgi:hypothetical protein